MLKNFDRRKKIAALLLLVFIMSGAVFLSPEKAEAQVTTRLEAIADNIWERITAVADKISAQVAALAFKTALSQFLNKMAYDMATAVATGAPGQKALIFDDPNYFLNLGDAVMGNAIDEIAQESGFTNILGTTSLCEPVDLTAKVNILLSFKKPTEPEKPRCSLSLMKKSLAESANSFANSFSLQNLSLRFEMGDLEESRNTLRKSLTIEKYLDLNSAIYANFSSTLTDLENISDNLSGLIQRIYQKPIADRQAAAESELKNLSEIQTQLILTQNRISQIQEMINDCGPESGNCSETGASGVCQNFIALVQPNCSAAVSTAQTYHGQFQKLATELTDGVNNLYDGILKKAFTAPEANNPQDIANAFNPEANPMGQYVLIKEAKDRNINVKIENEKLLQRISKDCEPKKDPVSGMNVLPSSAACGLFNFAMSKATVNEDTYTGIFSQAISIFTNTLAGKLLQTWFEKGVANLYDKGKGKNSTNATDLAAGNLARGKSAAEEKFLTLLQPSFAAGGPFEVIKELAVCPEKGAGPNNCAIDTDFAQAIAERLTVKEAMDKKLLDSKKPFGYVKSGGILVEPSFLNGYPYRSMIVLRKFRIIPVGWELAAEWIKDPNKNTTLTAYTIKQAVDCYENTGDCIFVKNGQPNPFYHLVDPGWVFLEQPAFCKRQGASEKILAEEFVCSQPSMADGSCSEYSRNVYRQEYCADEQTCIMKNEDGSCRFYGYCSLDQPVWKLDGTACNQEMNSCQTFADSKGSNVSYLEHSISSGGCNANNAGCQWYCEEAPLVCSGGEKNGEPCSYNNDCVDSKGLVDGVCRPTDLWKCQGKNLIVNGGVEINSSGWIGFGTGSNNRIDTSGYEGFASLSSADNSSNESGWQSLPISFYGGESIDASGWVNINVAGGGAGIKLRNLISNTIIAESEIITELNIWKPVHLAASISADTNMALELVAYNNATAMFDDIGLFRGNRISFDKDIKQCEAKDAGCREFSRTINGANLIFNPSFEIEEKNYSEAPAAGTDWYGWHLPDGENAPSSVAREPSFVKSGKASLKVENSAGTTVAVGPETADPRDSAINEEHKYLPEESYSISVYARAQVGCAGNCMELVGDCRGDDAALGTSSGSFSLTSSWEKYSYNFNYKKDKSLPYDTNYCRFFIRLTQNNTYWLDDVKLEIGRDATNYKDYGSDKVYLNDSRLSCDLSEVGCELYAPADGDAGIPAVARTSDQCPAECVSYETYHEAPSYFDPIEDAAPDVIFPNFIPATAAQCSAQAAGCEEFTNLDTVASGGEAKEYYTYIRQCAKPGTTAEATFYTWEGSEEAGFQLRAWRFKIYADGSPYATDSPLAPPADCDLSDPDCRVFYDQSGTTYQRLLSKTVFISDDCHPLRRTTQGTRQDCVDSGGRAEPAGINSTDIVTCYYDAIPSQGLKCQAADANCREYKGPSANSQRSLFKSDFEDASNPTQGWMPGTRNNESVSVGGNSLDLSAGLYDTERDISSIVQKNKTYLVKFWAKPNPANLNPTDILAQFNDGSSTINSGIITLLPDWNFYVLGPLDFTARDPGGAEKLIINANEAFYIDNIELIDAGDDSFVIKNSWKTPASCDLDPQGMIIPGYSLHCSAYTDRAKNIHNLKSFSKLCREDHVGCELLADTQNSNSPFAAWPQGEYVPQDRLVSVVNDDKKYCEAKSKGCQKFGRPEIDAADNVANWESVYLINNPDDYKEILCQNSENWCQEYKTPDGNIKYFKDPGEKLCEYKENIGVGNTVTSGWFIKGQYDKVNPPECFGAIRHCSKPRGESYLFCRTDSDCQPLDKDGNTEDLGVCVAKDTDWVRVCPESQNSCTEYKDPLFSRTQGIKDRYYYLGDTIDQGKCKGQIDEDQKCVAFNNTENPVMNVRSSGTCKAKPNLYCATNAECSAITPDDICLMKSDKPFDPQACIKCSADKSICGRAGELPCCDSIVENLAAIPPVMRACDANTILYVQKDRDCREWLSCVSSAKITNAKGEKENICYDVARCTELDPITGACKKRASDQNYCQSPKCNSGNNQCFFDSAVWCDDDADCAGIKRRCAIDNQCAQSAGLCDLAASPPSCKNDSARLCSKDFDCLVDQGPCVALEQTFDSPKQSDVPPHIGEVDDLRYRSGFNPFGLHWLNDIADLADDQTRDGEYNLTEMMQKGQMIILEDGDFEKQNSAWKRFSTCSQRGVQCVDNTSCLAGDMCDTATKACTVSGNGCFECSISKNACLVSGDCGGSETCGPTNNKCSVSDSCGGTCSVLGRQCRNTNDCGATGGTCNLSAKICFVSGAACPNGDLDCPGMNDFCRPSNSLSYERIKVLSGLQALKLDPGESVYQGNYPSAVFPASLPITISGNAQIAVSGYLNTIDLKNGDARVVIQEFDAKANNGNVSPIKETAILIQGFGKPWKFYAGIFKTQPETVSIRVVLSNTGTSGSAFFDNLLMLPVLNYQNQSYPIPFMEVYDSSRVGSGAVSLPGENPFIGRSCRLYPQTSAPACFYTNEQKQQFLGWRGFCVEPDPVNPLQCLQWLPIDQLQGETGLGFKTESSYSGRTPLYYCAEMSLWQLRCNNVQYWACNRPSESECPVSAGTDPSCPSTYYRGGGKVRWGKCVGESYCHVRGVDVLSSSNNGATDKDCVWVPYRSCPYGSMDPAQSITPNIIGRCDKLVEVVDSEGLNIAWADRIAQKSFQLMSPYGYIYNADQNNPLYGSILVMGAPSDMPGSWQEQFGKEFITLGGAVRNSECAPGFECRLNGVVYQCYDNGSNAFTATACDPRKDTALTRSFSGFYPLWILPKSEDQASPGENACLVSSGGSPLACSNPYCYNINPRTPPGPPTDAYPPFPESPWCSIDSMTKNPIDTIKSLELNVTQVNYANRASKNTAQINPTETFVQGAERLKHLFSKSYSTWVWNSGRCVDVIKSYLCAGGNEFDDFACVPGETGYRCSNNPSRACIDMTDDQACPGGSCIADNNFNPSCNAPFGKCTQAGGGVCLDSATGYAQKSCSAACLGGACMPILECSTKPSDPCVNLGDGCDIDIISGMPKGTCNYVYKCSTTNAACDPAQDCSPVGGQCPGGYCNDSGWMGGNCVGGVNNGKVCNAFDDSNHEGCRGGSCDFNSGQCTASSDRSGGVCGYTPVCTNLRCTDGSGTQYNFCASKGADISAIPDGIGDDDCKNVPTAGTNTECKPMASQICFPGGMNGGDYEMLKTCANDSECSGSAILDQCIEYKNRCVLWKNPNVFDFNGQPKVTGLEKVGQYCLGAGADLNGDSIGDDECAGSVDPNDDGLCAARWCEDGVNFQQICAINNPDCIIPLDSANKLAQQDAYVSVGDVNTTVDDRFRASLWTPPSNQCPSNSRPLISVDGSGNPTQDIIKESGELCGVAPRIENFVAGIGDSRSSSDITISAGDSVTISFTTSIDSQQRPIKFIAVDWDDPILGQTAIGPYADGTGLAPKTLKDDPFVFTSSPYMAKGVYTIRVMMKDNWYWCNGEIDDKGYYGNAYYCANNTNQQCTAATEAANCGGAGLCTIKGCDSINSAYWLAFPGKITVQ